MDAAEGKITQLEESLAQTTGQLTQAGYVRHDILVNKAAVGRLIGARGTTLQARAHTLL